MKYEQDSPCTLNKWSSSKFLEGYQLWEIPEEDQITQQPNIKIRTLVQMMIIKP